MTIMGCRYINLGLALAGLDKTGIHLIQYDGKELGPLFLPNTAFKTAALDDIGMYVLIPKLVKIFNLTLDQGITFFFAGLILLTALIGCIGFFLLYTSLSQRIVSLLSVACLAYYAFLVSDVYIAYFAAVSGVIPLMRYCFQKKRADFFTSICLLWSGLLIGTLQYVRAYSGLASLVFILGAMILHPWTKLQKFFLLVCLGLGIMIPIYYFSRVTDQSREYLAEHVSHQKQLPTVHPFWHTIYLGFGFLNYANQDGIQWDDTYALKKVQHVLQDPTIGYEHPQYESTLKAEVLNLIKYQSFFVYLTIFAKLGILLLYLIRYVHVGLLAALYLFEYSCSEVALLLSLLSSTIFPLIAIPAEQYAFGFICLAYLYGIDSINRLLHKDHIATSLKFGIASLFIIVSMKFFQLCTFKIIVVMSLLVAFAMLFLALHNKLITRYVNTSL